MDKKLTGLWFDGSFIYLYQIMINDVYLYFNKK